MNISVTIAAYNEAGSIGPLLQSICQAQYGKHKLGEVLVYDDASTDATASVVQAQAARFPVIRLIRGDRRLGCAPAIERLLAAASGDATVRVNADTAVCAGAIERLVDALDRGASVAIGVNQPVRVRTNVASLASRFAFDVVERLKAGRHPENYAVGHLVAYRADAVKQIRFPADLINDDRYIAVTVARNGGQIVYVPDARCLLKPASTALDYWRTSRRVLEGERQLRRLGFEPTPLTEVFGALAASAVRAPLRSLCWALMYSWSSVRRSPAHDARWQIAESTKGPIVG